MYRRMVQVSKHDLETEHLTGANRICTEIATTCQKSTDRGQQDLHSLCKSLRELAPIPAPCCFSRISTCSAVANLINFHNALHQVQYLERKAAHTQTICEFFDICKFANAWRLTLQTDILPRHRHFANR